MYVFRDSCGGGECDVKPVTPERDSFVRISVTDADDHTTQQISESRTLSLHSLGSASAHQQTVCRKKSLLCMVWLPRPSATTSRRTTFPTAWCNYAIQDDVQYGWCCFNSTYIRADKTEIWGQSFTFSGKHQILHSFSTDRCEQFFWRGPQKSVSVFENVAYTVWSVSVIFSPHLIIMPHRSTTYNVDAAYCYRPSSVVCRSVCHTSEPWRNSWTDRDAV